MKFERIFVEDQVRRHPNALKILERVRGPVQEISKVEEVFGRVRKPYLQKRNALSLFIGKKEGQLVKEAPAAYGLAGEPHYYFIHSYNCVYECEYCYLQGYFSSPDLVLFVNHEEIADEMRVLSRGARPGRRVWFHAGEFSDSLALSSLTREWSIYWKVFEENPQAVLELRTKSANTKAIEELEPLENVVVSYSLSPERQCATYDRKTPELHLRLEAIHRLADRGFRIGIHLDPIIDDGGDLEGEYQQLADQVFNGIPENQLAYVSLGVVRFAKDVFREVRRNYPSSGLLASEFISGFDSKIRYRRPHRLWLLKSVRRICREAGVPEEKIYLCMEDE